MSKSSLYLKLVGKGGRPIFGESIDKGHAGEVDLSGWNWSIADPAALPKESGTTTKSDPKSSAKAKSTTEAGADVGIKPSLLSFTKRTDRSTVPLIRAMDNAEILESATLVLEEEFQDAVLPFYLKIFLQDVVVMKLSWSVDVGTAGVDWKESWELNYSSIKFSYKVRKDQSGTIDMEFSRPMDDAGVAGKKAPLTAREKQEAEERRRAEDAKYLAKKTGR
jgi:type VI protein secretion system component Hcp